MYITRYFREDQTLYLDKSMKYCREHASVGIESVDGKKPRVSWKQIDSGTPWDVSAIVWDSYLERHVESERIPRCKIISIESFKVLRNAH